MEISLSLSLCSFFSRSVSIPIFFLTLSLSLSLPLCSPCELDDIPEAAFYMVGGIEEAVSNAEQLAAQHK